MSAKVKTPSLPIFEEMMETESDLKPEPTRNVALVFSLIALSAIAVIFALLSVMGTLEVKEQAKHARMESLASTVAVGNSWQETRNELPGKNPRGLLIKEWKTGTPADIDMVAKSLGISMESVAYPAGCQEGHSGEFLVQLCQKSDNKTFSLIIA